MRAHRDRRLHTVGLRRSLARRESHNRDRVPGTRARVLCPLRHERQGTDTDNGAPYISTVHAIACRALGIRHLRTRPYRPQTNGKAERFIRTMLAGWAYGAIYASSKDRTAALDGWLWTYNHRRRHSAIGHKPPAEHLNNLLRTYS
jgi:transposase InsO family protein